MIFWIPILAGLIIAKKKWIKILSFIALIIYCLFVIFALEDFPNYAKNKLIFNEIKNFIIALGIVLFIWFSYSKTTKQVSKKERNEDSENKLFNANSTTQKINNILKINNLNEKELKNNSLTFKFKNVVDVILILIIIALFVIILRVLWEKDWEGFFYTLSAELCFCYLFIEYLKNKLYAHIIFLILFGIFSFFLVVVVVVNDSELLFLFLFLINFAVLLYFYERIKISLKHKEMQ